MCGITLTFGTRDETLIREMTARLEHRGPDGGGVAAFGPTFLGHRRLAILDLPGGGQPMTNETGELGVSFNGEIYNHLELRSLLEGRHRFATRSDTEVILHLYEEKGEDIFGLLNGMFAIALAGPDNFLIARDPLGIKPLYYGRKDGIILASSELKAFPRMDEIHVLPPGHSIDRDLVPKRFSQPYPPFSPLIVPPLPEALAGIRRLLETAVVKRLMSDVPVGVYLSGGLDSSLVAALMRPHVVELHSFAAGMENAPDLAAAREVARFLGTEHHELIYTAQDVEAALPEVIAALESFDAPLVRSAVPMYLVSSLAALYVKVVLSGEGADEVFAGYAYLASHGDGEELRTELDGLVSGLHDTNLQRTDRMSMAHGLEARVPFLDLDLLRYVRRLPAKLLAQLPGRQEKWLLREACRGLIPPAALERKKLKFSEGAGSSEVVAERLTADADFEARREVAPGLTLRSPEELFYFRLWRTAFGPDIDPRLVGRTRDPRAATSSVPPSEGRLR